MKRWLRRLSVALLLTLLLLVLCEVLSYALLAALNPDFARALRSEHLLLATWFPAQPPNTPDRRSDAIPLHALYGWRYTAPALFSGLAVDAQGFVLNHASATSALDLTADYRVMLIGGSTVAGSGASANDQTIAAQLAMLLAYYTGRHTNVVNAGTGGWYSANELAFLTQQALPFHAPDVIIVLDGYNDLWRSTLAARQFRPQTDGSWRSARPDFLYDWTLQANQSRLQMPAGEASYHFNWHRLFTTAWLFSRNEAAATPMPRYLPALTAFDEDACPPVPFDLHPYNSHLRSMIGAAQAHQVAILVVLQPAIGYKAKLTASERLGYDQMRAIVFAGDLADYGVPPGTCLDVMQRDYFTQAQALFAELAADLTAPQVSIIDLSQLFTTTTEAVFYDYAHYTDLGNQRIAAALVEPTRRLLPKITPPDDS